MKLRQYISESNNEYQSRLFAHELDKKRKEKDYYDSLTDKQKKARSERQAKNDKYNKMVRKRNREYFKNKRNN